MAGERIAGLDTAVSWLKRFFGWIRLDGSPPGGGADMYRMIPSFDCQNVMPDWTEAVQAALLSARGWCLSNGNVSDD